MRQASRIACIVAFGLVLSACGGSGGGGTVPAGDLACADPGCGRETLPPAPLVCGGAEAATCPQGYRCVDEPADSCDAATGVDCAGICVLGEELPRCGELLGPSCPAGSVCADDPADACEGGPAVDCPGICRPEADGDCSTDAECPELDVPCTICADGSESCPHSRCELGKCTVDFKPCSEAQVCGGIAGLVCPAGFECIDDPSDGCDPNDGGADCPGRCEPAPAGECKTDAECPLLRAPCSVCADGTEACPRFFCDGGRCSVVFPTCSTPGGCRDDSECKPGDVCVHDPNTCDPATGATPCADVCVPDTKPRPCGGLVGATCPAGFECVDDRRDECDPDSGGADCPGVCMPATTPQCRADDECPHVLAPCSLCADGSYACPRSQCREGVCSVVFEACTGPGFCGGIAGFSCPPGSTCIDDPKDDCDPNQGGADCGGVCVREEEPQRCGGFTGEPCPAGYECLDDARDDCDPAAGGADCPGICRPAPSPVCTSDADCPVIGAPCRLCADGSAACPRSFCDAGKCRAEFETCKGEQ